MKRKMSLSAPSSQLHPSPQVPGHTDSEQIDSALPQRLTSGNIAVSPKSKDTAYVAPPLPPHLPPFCVAGTPPSSVHEVHPLSAPFRSWKQPWPC